MSDSSLLLSLVLVHILADFFLQPTAWVQARAERHWRCSQLYFHGLIHFGLNLLLLILWYRLSWSAVSVISVFSLALLIAVSHLLIDVAKSYFTGLRYFVLDQLLHVLIIMLVWLYLTDTGYPALLNLATGLLRAEHLLLLLAYLLLMKPASVVISLVLTKISAPATNAKQGSPAAGHLIGIAERLLILTLILAGQYSGVGLVVAAKSVLRYNDLRDSHDRALTEYILLGSLLSFGFTLLIAIILLKFLPFRAAGSW
ncbi:MULTISPECIES: DUF3307 domain-containing protein [unclassified Arsukibacterium]|uniref:DUF3307 domain-containing protein n=1 Tax=unclassified Arsukibacterium TaxID=2635278 RepID=UPI000C4A7170|nr:MULTISPECIES: DUF3307 domain-containing protein [unclassified Arsukibacterium]MAA94120.1 hypothetical protein [Rheinheimera sp.]MBM35161.1 hypothetical protein [Rheinheimera sp.]HAW93533.1 DUF3307 domain-containing protein [Candidatus Azambacteria bacterium]|tara:strand:- start:28 stop:798 length:771 start_codon:yes stop_codon:yes gene_type:complete